MASSKGSTGTAKANVSEQICQAIQSTSNLLHLMQQSSPSQEHLVRLPKSLVVKSSLARNTGKVLDQLPRVVSSLDAHMETGLRSVSKLKTVSQLLSNMESSQLQNVVRVGQPIEELGNTYMRFKTLTSTSKLHDV